MAELSTTGMDGLLKTALARLRGRALRRAVVGKVLGRSFRAADASLVRPHALQPENIHRILVLRPNHRLGNIVLLTPLIAEIESRFPGAELDVLVAGDAARDVLAAFPTIRHIHALPHYVLRHPLAALRIVLGLRRTRYDLVIDASADSNSTRLLMSWLKPRKSIASPGADSKIRSDWIEAMATAPSHFAKLPIFRLRQSLLHMADVYPEQYPSLDLRLTRFERRQGQKILDALLPRSDDGARPMSIGIFANASGAKCFDPAWWNQFLEPLLRSSARLHIVEFVPADARSRLGTHFPTYFSSCPRKLAAVISNLTCFVSADCGVMHLASASGAPTMGLFAVTDLAAYTPYGRHNLGMNTIGRSAAELGEVTRRLIESAIADSHPKTTPERLAARSTIASVANSAWSREVAAVAPGVLARQS